MLCPTVRTSHRWKRVWDGGAPGLAQFLVGLILLGLASGLYISARLGAGPRVRWVASRWTRTASISGR